MKCIDPKWRWIERPVDDRKEHIELRHGDAGKAPYENWQPIARIGKPKHCLFQVQWLINPDSPENLALLEDTRRELDFYLVEKGESDPWAYAQYHCTTSANMYSSIHWSYFRHGTAERVSSVVMQTGDPLCIVVSRDEVRRQDTSSVLATLKSLLQTPEKARAYKESVDIAFDGYNEDPSELDEIEEVREFVHRLDAAFPFWLFFMSKHMLGLQCIVFCHLLPFLTAEGKAEHHPRQLEQLLTKRWFPAMNQAAQYAGLTEKEIEDMTDRFMMYMKNGRLL